MKKQFFKVLSVLLSIMMVLSVCSVVALADTSDIPSYYVKAGGTGDGRSLSNPAKTVASAVASMNADGYKAGDTVNIYLVQEGAISKATLTDGYHDLPSWRDASAGETMPAYTAKIVVQPYSTNEGITYLAESTKYGDIHPTLSANGPTVLQMVAPVTVRGSYNTPFIVAGPNEFTWIYEDGYSTAYYLHSDGSLQLAWAPTISTSLGGEIEGEVNLNVAGYALFGSMVIGCQNSDIGPITYKDDVNVTFNHPSIGSHSSMTYTATLAQQDITFEKNLNVIVKDVADMQFAAGAGTVTVNGGVNYMVAPGETVLAHLDTLTNFAEGTKIFNVVPATMPIMNSISFGDGVGVLNVTQGLKATNDETDEVVLYDEETMTLTLPEAGKWTIETYHAPMTGDYYVKSGGTGDGKTPETPAASVIEVVKTINADGFVSGDVANIYLIQDPEIIFPGDNSHNMPVWGVTGGQAPLHSALIKIRPYAENEGTTYLSQSATCGAINQVIHLGGPTDIDSIMLVSNRGAWQDEFYICGYDFTLGSSVSFGQVSGGSTSVSYDHMGAISANGWYAGTGPYDKEVNINFLASQAIAQDTYDGFTFGNVYDRASTSIYNKDVNVTFDNKGLGGTRTYPIYFRGTNTFNRNLNLKVVNATNITFTGAGEITVAGGVQLLTNATTVYPNDLAGIAAFADGTKFYKIVADSTIFDYIDFTKTAGTYAISGDKQAMAINADGEMILSEDGILTVPTGEWTVSVYVAPKSVNYYVKNGGTGDGKTAETPAATIADVMNTIAADDLSINDTAIINVIEREDWDAAPVDGVHNMPSLGGASVNVTPKVVIQSASEDAKAHLAMNPNVTSRHVDFGESFIFRNIVLVATGAKNTEYYFNGNSVKFESTVEFAHIDGSYAGGALGASYADISANKYIASGNVANKQTIEIEAPLKSGTISIPANNFNAYSHTADLSYVLDNKDISVNIAFAGGHSNAVTTNFTKNVNINVKNANTVNFVSGANANGNQFINVAGGLQLILNTAAKYNTFDIGSIASITDSTPIYVIKNGTGNADILSFTDVAGTYKVTSENTVYAVSDNGAEVYAEGGKIVLSAGTWTIKEKIPPKGVHYYVQYGGTGDGRTLENPAASVYAVTASIAEDLTAQDTAYVNIIQSEDYNIAPEGGTGNYLTSWTGGTPVAHAATMIVQGYGDTKPYLAYGNGAGISNGGNVSIDLYGPTVIQNVTLVATWSNYQRNIYANGYSITVEPTVGFASLDAGFNGTNFGSSYGHIINATGYLTSATYSNDQTITYNVGTIADHEIRIPSGNYSPTTYNADLNLIVNADNVGNVNPLTIYFGAGHSNEFTSTFKNININVKAGKKVNFANGANANGLQKVKADAIQAILNPNVTYNTTDIASIASITDDTPVYVLEVYSDVKEAIAFTETAGTFRVLVDGKDAVAVAADGTKYQSKDGVLTVPAGNYKVNFVEENSNEFAEYINKRGTDLQNTYNKLVNDKELTVVYFGGSVTNGYGIQEGEECWRTMIGNWIQNSFPEATVNNINAACGESGTFLGSYRVARDVIGEKPDLLFLEYSINDKYDFASYAKASYQYETIVRQVKEELPDCDIVTILVTDSGAVSAAYKQNGGTLHTQAQAHEDMAKIYNIPSLHVGRRLADKTAGTWNKDVSIDTVHLTEYGNELYYDVIHEYFCNELIHGGYTGEAAPAYVMPALQSEQLLDGNMTYIEPSQALVDRSEELGGTGISYAHAPEFGVGGYDEIFYIGKNGTDRILAIEFEGTELIGLFHNYSGSDTFEISIDGGEYVKKNYYHMNPTTFITGLESGKHVARIKFNHSKDWQWLGAVYSRDADLQTAKQYGLTVEGGNAFTKLSGEAAAATAGKDVTVTIKANIPENAKFTGWEVVSGNVTLADATAETTTFKMVGEAVEVKANYEIEEPEVPEAIVEYTTVEYDLDINKLSVGYAAPNAALIAAVQAGGKDTDGRVVQIVADIDGKEVPFTASITTNGGKFIIQGFSVYLMNQPLSLFVRVSNANTGYLWESNTFEICIADFLAEKAATDEKAAAWVALNEVWATGNETIAVENATIEEGLLNVTGVAYDTAKSRLTLTYAKPNAELIAMLKAGGTEQDGRIVELVVAMDGKEVKFPAKIMSGGGTMYVEGLSLSHFDIEIELFVRVTNANTSYAAETNSVTVKLADVMADATDSDFAAAYRKYMNAEAEDLVVNATVETTEELLAALSAANDNDVILLKAGDYDAVNIFSVAANNVTILGEDGAVVYGLTFVGADVSGLTIKNVTFATNLNFNASVSGITIEECTFNTDACITEPDNGGIVITDINIFDTTFEGNLDGTDSAIKLATINNLTVTGCTFTNIDYNAIQVYYPGGTVLIDGNTINNTGSRVFRFTNVTGDITISNNTIVSTGDEAGELAKASNPCTIILDSNTWNGLSDAEVADRLININ